MSHITSVKFVQCKLSPSNYSLQANVSLLALACTIFIVSDVPLVATCNLLILAFALYQQHRPLVNSLLGDVLFHADGRVVVNSETRWFDKSFTHLVELFVLIRIEREWYLVWRDSVDEQHYWQLLMLLKKEP